MKMEHNYCRSESSIGSESGIGSLSDEIYGAHSYGYTLKSKPISSVPPSFKTMRLQYRTLMKQQLQREQLRDEEMRTQKRHKQIPVSQQQQQPVAIDIPTIIQPGHQQVLKVSTPLENPTKYHVEEARKQQYLYAEESGEFGTSLDSSIARSSEVEELIDNVLSLEASEDAKSKASSVESSHLGQASIEAIIGPVDNGYLDINAFASPNSCSAETVHLTDAELQAAMTKDRQKRDNHNMIERRRRQNINDKIKELGCLLPSTNDPYRDVVKDSSKYKGTILKASVEYMKQLKSDNEKLKKQNDEKDELIKQCVQYSQTLHQFTQEMKVHCEAEGVDVSQFVLPLPPALIYEEPEQNNNWATVNLDELMDDNDPMFCTFNEEDMMEHS